MKQVYANWGCYQVRIDYDPQDINRFDVYYAGNGDLEGLRYRKLTTPEVRAALEAIHRAEKLPIKEITENTMANVKDNLTFLRDRIAVEAMSARIQSGFFIDTEVRRLKLAKQMYAMADAALGVRDNVEVCATCGQEKK